MRMTVGQIDEAGFIWLFFAKPVVKAVGRAAKKGNLVKKVSRVAKAAKEGAEAGAQAGVKGDSTAPRSSR